jgi:hypothetical protein
VECDERNILAVKPQHTRGNIHQTEGRSSSEIQVSASESSAAFPSHAFQQTLQTAMDFLLLVWVGIKFIPKWAILTPYFTMANTRRSPS